MGPAARIAARIGGALVLLAVGLLALLHPGAAGAFSATQTKTYSTAGASSTFTFTGLQPATSSVSVTVDLYGDFDSSSEYADVTIDGTSMAQHDGSSTQCNTTASSKTYSVSSSTVSDGKLTVVVTNSSAVSGTICTTHKVAVKVSYTAKPDLTVTAVVAPYSGSTSKAGDSFAVQYKIKCWHEAVSTNFSVDLLHCPTAAGSGCVLLKQASITSDFSAAQTRTFTASSLTLPNSAEAGTSYVRVDVDSKKNISETVETNNTRVDAITVTAKPDLSFTGHTVPTSGASSVSPGAVISGSFKIANAASTSAVRTDWTIAYELCTSKTSSSCTQLATQKVTKDLDSGDTYTMTASLKIPSTTPAGTCYIRALADSTKLVAESDETNNERFATITVSGSVVDGGPVPDGGPVADAAGAGEGGARSDGPSKADGAWYWPDTASTGDGPAAGGDGAGQEAEGGCGCAVPLPARSVAGHAPLLLLLLLVLLWRAGSRRR